MKLRCCFVLLTGVFAIPGCVAPDATPSESQRAAAQVVLPPRDTPDPATTCASDPRVVAGVVTAQTCVGAQLFFRGTFGGNGRTCATCHRVDNNLTIDPTFIATLPANDPLFVAEFDQDLQDLEKPTQMHRFGVILENVDGFDPDPRTHFVLRSVPHTQSLATSVTRPPGGPNPPADRTGWSGDGAPGTGALRDFMTGAIRQHYTQTLARVAGTDFQLASDTELDRIDRFMRRIGRSNELALSTVTMTDPGAEAGRTKFLQVGCNLCHGNAGANAGGANQNFNTGVESSRNPALAMFPQDGGFGTVGATSAAFGDGTFNVPPLVEAADTGPFFHTATSIVGASAHNVATATTIEEAIAFYDSPAFNSSPAGQVLPIALNPTQIDNIGRFLRGVNAAFSAAIALKRIDAELAIIGQFHNNQLAIQRELIRLANVEVGDAIRVLSAVQGLDPSSLTSFQKAATRLGQAQTDAAEADRLADVTAARQQVVDGSSAIGTNLSYDIGEGSVMF
jgi:cytochrome c peroxidase